VGVIVGEINHFPIFAGTPHSALLGRYHEQQHAGLTSGHALCSHVARHHLSPCADACLCACLPFARGRACTCHLTFFTAVLQRIVDAQHLPGGVTLKVRDVRSGERGQHSVCAEAWRLPKRHLPHAVKSRMMSKLTQAMRQRQLLPWPGQGQQATLMQPSSWVDSGGTPVHMPTIASANALNAFADAGGAGERGTGSSHDELGPLPGGMPSVGAVGKSLSTRIQSCPELHTCVPSSLSYHQLQGLELQVLALLLCGRRENLAQRVLARCVRSLAV
jgi:hypothetical protein